MLLVPRSTVVPRIETLGDEQLELFLPEFFDGAAGLDVLEPRWLEHEFELAGLELGGVRACRVGKQRKRRQRYETGPDHARPPSLPLSAILSERVYFVNAIEGIRHAAVGSGFLEKM